MIGMVMAIQIELEIMSLKYKYNHEKNADKKPLKRSRGQYSQPSKKIYVLLKDKKEIHKTVTDLGIYYKQIKNVLKLKLPAQVSFFDVQLQQ